MHLPLFGQDIVELLVIPPCHPIQLCRWDNLLRITKYMNINQKVKARSGKKNGANVNNNHKGLFLHKYHDGKR